MSPAYRNAVAVLTLAGAFAAASPAAAVFWPSAGEWEGTSSPPRHDTIAYVDLATWKLVTLVTDAGGLQPVTVFDPSPLPWIPVAGDWDGDGFDSILMFNTRNWSLVGAERGPVAPNEVGGDPSPTPWRPVAGDFDGDGRDTVLVYDLRDGRTYRPEAGPLTAEGYRPDPQPEIPMAGDWDGDGIDTIGTIRMGDPSPTPWIPVAGDFDGDGIDTMAAVYGPTGELAELEREQSAGKSASTSKTGIRIPEGCYLMIRTKNFWMKLPDGTGGYIIEIVSVSRTWLCCQTLVGGPYVCELQR